MSEVATLGNIFFEPGRTFEDLRRKPRFVMAFVIIAILTTAYGFGLYYKIGDAGIRRFISEQMDRSPQASGLSPDQKENAINLNMKIGGVVRYAMPVFVVVTIFLGGLFYWLGSKAFGGSGTYLTGVAVWTYSTLPPAIVGMVANGIVLIFKSADDIDFAASQRGVVHANLGFLVDGKAAPVLATLLGTFDVFLIWGWVLAAIGLKISNKLSGAAAWSIVIIFALVGVAFRVIGAVFSGNAN